MRTIHVWFTRLPDLNILESDLVTSNLISSLSNVAQMLSNGEFFVLSSCHQYNTGQLPVLYSANDLNETRKTRKVLDWRLRLDAH